MSVARPRLSRLLAAASVACGAAALWAPFGCGPDCPTIDRYYAGGTVTKDGTALTYQTAPMAGPFIPFEGGTVYHITHHLGVVPSDVEIYLAFNEGPFEVNAGGFSLASGNQALVAEASADDITIVNDSCSSFFLRLVLRGSTATPMDAGTD
jgi:hypothetical protein